MDDFDSDFNVYDYNDDFNVYDYDDDVPNFVDEQYKCDYDDEFLINVLDDDNGEREDIGDGIFCDGDVIGGELIDNDDYNDYQVELPGVDEDAFCVDLNDDEYSEEYYDEFPEVNDDDDVTIGDLYYEYSGYDISVGLEDLMGDLMVEDMEIVNLRDQDEYGTVHVNIQRPSRTEIASSSSSFSITNGRTSSGANLVDTDRCFRVYFNGLVREEKVGVLGDKNVIMAAIGAAVCDPRDNLVVDVKKPLMDDFEGKDLLIMTEVAELRALIEGLEAALSFPVERVTFFCHDYMLYQYVTGRVRPRHGKIAVLIDKVAVLQRKFTYCNPSLVARNDMKFAFKFAKDTLDSQIIDLPSKTAKGKNIVKETCKICFEDADIDQMFTIDRCRHMYCISCMKQHVEVKLLSNVTVKCPHEECETEVSFESCKKFLSPKLVEVISQRIKESSIPVTEKVYCPNPRCSTLMSKSEVLGYIKELHVDAEESGIRKCMKCHELFCIKCRVPWHYGMTCNDYNTSSSYSGTEDAKLKSLASQKLWRQCAKCNHMVELAQGCYHITCRCGCEFCYSCGAEWKNKQPTCSCPRWDEPFIILE